MCIRRCAPALLVAAALTVATACSQAGTEHPRGAAKERLARAGLRVVIPRGWQGRIVRADRGSSSPAIEAANFRLAPVSASVVVPSPAGLTRSQVRLVLLELGNPPGRRFPPTRGMQPLLPADFAFRLPEVPAARVRAATLLAGRSLVQSDGRVRRPPGPGSSAASCRRAARVASDRGPP